MFSWSRSLFGRLLKGKPGKRSGHLLITDSSFLRLWSMGRTDKLGKVLCDLKTWKVYLGRRWVEHGVPGEKSQYSSTKVTRKGASCWGRFPTKSCLQIPICQTSFHFYGIRGEGLSSVISLCWHRAPHSQSGSTWVCSISLLTILVACLHTQAEQATIILIPTKV